MTWVVPVFSKSRVNAAGEQLAAAPVAEDLEHELEVLNNWRAAHAFPLNSIQMDLRQKARRVYPHASIAQRLKRAPSIIRKLQREDRMQLARMQDIAGCRAVVLSISEVHRLQEAFSRSRSRNELLNLKDYIAAPKASGYRGIHLVYRFQSDSLPEFNGKLVEIQLRSRLQHAWATAVETVGTLLRQALKASEGEERWLQFFKVVGSAFALEERTSLVLGTPTGREELRAWLASEVVALDVRSRLETYSTALRLPADMRMQGSHYFLLSLLPREGRLLVRGFRRNEFDRATAAYLAEEKQLSLFPGRETVLIAAESLRDLRRTHPNYFLDTQVFLEQLERVTSRPVRGARSEKQQA